MGAVSVASHLSHLPFAVNAPGGVPVHHTHSPLPPPPPPFEATTNVDDLIGFVYQPQLRRTLGLWPLLAFGLVFMVPIAPFGIFGGVFAASSGMVALAYTVGALVMLLTACSYTQMVRAFPMAGSVYNYAGRGIGPRIGFLAGWAMLLDYVLVPGLLSLIAAVACHAAIPPLPVWMWIVGFLLLNTVINLCGLRLTARVTSAFLITELVVLAVFLAVGVWALSQGRGQGLSLDPVFSPDTFTWPVLFTAVSVAVLSFLGFDGISMLAEENRGGSRQIGVAMTGALLLVGVLFIAQTWVASLLVADPAKLIADGDPDGTAFYDAARVAGGHWLATLTAVATALAWGIANSLVAQVSTSRLLFAMARDQQLPRFLARVSVRRSVPVNAVLLVAALSMVLGLYMASRSDGIAVLSSLINFGAIIAFGTLHASVIWHHLLRRRSRRFAVHLLIPVAGIGILGAVAIHANILAQKVGLTWLGLGLLVLIALTLAGHSPRLSGLGA
ncbi:MAG: APC family permease [Dactylosporangium sp.]|nr:APC family permease [Dactylosporangium sp.]NNJ62152.1 APC family permease [Dactylosporangium sp.]